MIGDRVERKRRIKDDPKAFLLITGIELLLTDMGKSVSGAVSKDQDLSLDTEQKHLLIQNVK